jgi:hypothetical protein
MGKAYGSGSLSGFESMTFYSLGIASPGLSFGQLPLLCLLRNPKQLSNAPVQITFDAAEI